MKAAISTSYGLWNGVPHQSMLISQVSMREARWGAGYPGNPRTSAHASL